MNEDRAIIFKCKDCGCEFAVKEKYVEHNKESHKYISCPKYGKHRNLHVIGQKSWKMIMEERSAVPL